MNLEESVRKYSLNLSQNSSDNLDFNDINHRLMKNSVVKWLNRGLIKLSPCNIYMYI